MTKFHYALLAFALLSFVVGAIIVAIRATRPRDLLTDSNGVPFKGGVPNPALRPDAQNERDA